MYTYIHIPVHIHIIWYNRFISSPWFLEWIIINLINIFIEDFISKWSMHELVLIFSHFDVILQFWDE